MANKKVYYGILGGVLGLAVGIVVGGYLGLIIGGTFLGGFKIYQHTGFEGYKLASYIGAIIGGVVLAVLGVRLGVGKAKRTDI
jgi:hypothetical protein